jgi:hypothetical protein
MGRPVAFARSAAWIAIVISIPLIAIGLFLRDLFPLDWQDWAVAGTIVAGTAGAIVTLRQHSKARALTWLVSLAIVAMLVVYDVLDAIIDPFFQADWLIIIVAILLVAGLGHLLSVLISDDE